MQFSSLKVGTRLSVGFAAVLVLLLIVTLLGVTRMNTLQKELQDFATNDLAMIEAVGALQSTGLRQGVMVRDLIIQETVAKQKEAFKGLKESYKTFDATIAIVDKLAQATDPGDLAYSKKIAAQQAKLRPLLSEVADLVDNTEFDVAKKSVNEKITPMQAELIASLDEFRKHLEGEAQQAAQSAEQVYHTSLVIMLVLAAVAVVVGVGVAFLVTRSIAGPLDRSVRFARQVSAGDLTVRMDASGHDELAELMRALNEMSTRLAGTVASIRQEADKVSSSANSLSGETDRVASRAGVQSERIMTVSSALEEMAVATSEVNSNASGVSDAAARAKDLSEQGNQDMERNLRVVEDIVSAVNESGSQISELSQAIGRINEIASVIKEIADQTNLLALNAAIEAARAGEQGRGFAVVADEVRKLAERTAASTADISNMIENIGAKTNGAVASMHKVKQDVESGATYTRNVGEKLQQIVEAVSHVSDLASHIAEATREQSAASDQTAKSMEEINSITEETHAAITEVESASQELAGTAAELQRLVAQFQVG